MKYGAPWHLGFTRVAAATLLAGLISIVGWAGSAPANDIAPTSRYFIALGGDAESGGPARPTTDPIGMVPWVGVANWFSPRLHESNGESDAANLRILIPFRIGSLLQVARISVPFAIEPPPEAGLNDPDENLADLPTGGSSLGDIGAYDLLVLRVMHGRFGIGPQFEFPTAVSAAQGSGMWSAGPAVGYVTERGRWQLGIFSQNLFSFAGDPGGKPVRISKVAPIIKFALGHGFSVGTSAMNFAYSYHRHAWLNVPLGLKLSDLTYLAARPVNLSVEAEYNTADQPATPIWTLRFGAMIFFPPD